MELMGNIAARYNKEQNEHMKRRISRMYTWLMHAVEMANEQMDDAPSDSLGAYWEGYKNACVAMMEL